MQYGIQHMLYLGERQNSLNDVFKYTFFHALLDEWGDDVEPLKIWRFLDIDAYHYKYTDLLKLLPATDRKSVYTVCCF